MTLLPTKKTEPSFDFKKEKVLLYGDWGVGKTQLVAHLDDEVLFLATERGHSKVSAYVIDIINYTDFLTAIDEITASNKFSIIAVDTIENLWRRYVDWFCKEHGVNHENEIAFKGHDMLRRGFVSSFLKLQDSGRGFVLISHTKEDMDENGATVIRPNCPHDKQNEIRDAICGICDYIWFMRMEKVLEAGKPVDARVVRTALKPNYVARSRYPMRDPVILDEGDPARSARRLIHEYGKAAAQKADKKEEKK